MPIVGAYFVKLEVGHVGTPGAPILHLALVVNAPTGAIGGTAEITQAIAPPNGEIEIPHVTGQIRHLGLGHDTIIVTLSGQYIVSVPPPAIGSYLAKFEAVLHVDKSWKGTGSFTYGGHTVDNVPVKVLEE
jgi:hypothetical protein